MTLAKEKFELIDFTAPSADNKALNVLLNSINNKKWLRDSTPDEIATKIKELQKKDVPGLVRGRETVKNTIKALTRLMEVKKEDLALQTGGKKSKKTKKILKKIVGKKIVRKHRGIIQIGGNIGRLKKGFKFSGKRLKSGMPEILKVKSKK